MKHSSVFILFVLLTFSIKANTKPDILDDKNLGKYFNSSDLKDIYRIVKYVDSIVVNSTHEDIEKLAYHKYLDSLYNCLDSCGFVFDQAKKYMFMATLNSELVNKIWRTETHVNEVRNKDTILYNLDDFPYIELNASGNYLKYLEKLGNKDPFFKELAKIIIMTGDMPPTVIAGFLHNNGKYDFDTIEYRLWAAVFLMTLEESTESKIDRYLNQ